VDKYLKLLKQVSHFKHLKLSDLTYILNSGQLKRYREDRIIVHESAPSAGMFVLLRGKVNLCNYSCDGQMQILSVIEPVIMFNELTAIDGGPNPMTAIAVEDCLTWNIGHQDFERLVRHYPDPAIGLAMMRVLAERTRDLIERCEDLSFRSVLARVAKLILELSEGGKREIDREQYSIMELSARVSTAPESISRSLSNLADRGFISSDRRRISVQNAKQLVEIAKLDSTESQSLD
jgi:CRP-like cAMP-binding protein